MKQLLQSLKDGSTQLANVPSPGVTDGQLLVRTHSTLVSAGTERMLVEFGKANWLDKARQQPDKVRMVIDKVRTDGLAVTIEAVRSKLDQPLALGYCNVGVVVAVGAGVEGFAVGDRVSCNGKHAEVVSVPKHLCARIPQGVSDEDAAFTVLASIGLQGIRLANPTLGECVVVTGLGLIGLLTVQMLRAQGCRVLGIDFDAQRLATARKFGAETIDLGKGEDVIGRAAVFSRGRGVDAVIITASTKSNEPVSQAATMCRQRGRIVLVGVTGLELSRADFYEKELNFQVSCSYGPGRYDAGYEDAGRDYPIGFVRWTEQRNFEAVLDLMATNHLQTAPLISHRFSLMHANNAYELLASDTPSLGILLEYPAASNDVMVASDLAARTVTLAPTQETIRSGVSVGFIGAGNYAGRHLIPAFKAAGATLHTIVSSGGVSAVHHGSKHGFANASTDTSATLANLNIDTVVIATRHSSHAQQVMNALRAGKHIFCEKPLCLTLDELAAIENEARNRPQQLLMVGFNRRYAPQVVRMKQLLQDERAPKTVVMTVNAGAIPAGHWTQDTEVGGGRIVGEACHFIDLMRHVVGAQIISHSIAAIGHQISSDIVSDKSTITLRFADGSVGTVHYFANGDKGFPKERLEVFCNGRILQLDNFRKLRGWGWHRFSKMNLWRQDKGQVACAKAFVDAVKNGTHSPISLDEIIEVCRTSIEVQRASL
jgi:predicted dehydrogenase/threonine dehydrogenase-like Zn-dependent dehydrogenase